MAFLFGYLSGSNFTIKHASCMKVSFGEFEASYGWSKWSERLGKAGPTLDRLKLTKNFTLYKQWKTSLCGGVTRLLLMPGQATYSCSTHTHVHLYMDISILFKICCTSYFVCKISILAIAMNNLQVYEQYRLLLCLNSRLKQHLNKCSRC